MLLRLAVYVFCTCLAVLSIGAASYVEQVLATGPVAYWRFETANDASLTNSFTNSYVGNATISAAGDGVPLSGLPPNRALTLDGDGDFVRTSLDTEHLFADAGTIVAWVNLDALPFASGRTFSIASKFDFGNDFDLEFHQDGRLVGMVGQFPNVFYQAHPPFTTGAWYHVALAFDDTTGFERLYVNGQLVGDFPVASGRTGNTNELVLGDHNRFPGRGFAGRIDELAVFDRALSSSEVQALFGTAGVSTPAPQPAVKFTLEVSRYTGSVMDGGWSFWGLNLHLDTIPNSFGGSNALYSPGSNHFVRVGGPYGFLTGSGRAYGTIEEAIHEATNGLWTLVLDEASPSERIYRFPVSISNLASNLFPHHAITSPVDGSQGNGASTPFTWTSTLPWDTNHVQLSGAGFASDELPAGTTEWTNVPPLMNGLYTFHVRAATNASTWIAVGAALDETNGPLPGWDRGGILGEHAEIKFRVGTLAILEPDLRAHLTFDDAGWLGYDSSGKENHALQTWFTAPPEFNDVDQFVGDGAASFSGGGWLEFESEFSQVFLGDFTVAVWLKTSQTLGDDSDSAMNGAGIVSANENGWVNDTIPIALTGARAAFLTGNPDETLHSETDINTDEWVHVVVTRRLGTGEKRIYINGQLDTQGSGNGNALDAVGRVMVGYGGSGYEGLLDDLQIYNAALSPEQVSILYDNPGSVIGGFSSLGDAVDANQYTWFTRGDAGWYGQTEITHDGEDAAQSGALLDGQESTIGAFVTGPGTLSFWWRVDSLDFSPNYYVSIDGFTDNYAYQGDWYEESIIIPPGTHEVTWTYSLQFASAALAFGDVLPGVIVPGTQDAAWLDEVTFSDQVQPVITGHPGNITAEAGSNVTLQVTYFANPLPQFQWYRNGQPIVGATNASFTLTNAQQSDSGNYFVTLDNPLGSDSSIAAQVRIYRPTDLRVLAIESPATATASTRVPFVWSVTNTGPGTISNWVDRVVFSDNPDLEFASFIGFAFGSTLGAAEGYSRSNSLLLPSVPAGNYFLGLRLDAENAVLETNEPNNVVVVPITLINADLEPTTLQASPVIGGRTVQITWSVTNHGPGYVQSTSWRDDFYLSTDNQFSFDDVSLGGIGHSGRLNPGEVLRRTNTFSVPVIAPGSHFLLARIDTFQAIAEGNEGNNLLALPITVTAADLVPTNIIAPSIAATREPVNLRWVIHNAGDGEAGAYSPFFGPEWYDEVYLSTNTTVGAGDIQLGEFYWGGYSADIFPWSTPLPAGASITNGALVDMPDVPEGSYYLVVRTDSANYVRELIETNNTFAVPITIATPDLAATALNAPSAAEARASISVNWSVANTGAGIAYPDWTDRLYLSTDATYGAGDILVGQRERTSQLQPGSNYFATNIVTLPGVAAGNYFLLLFTEAGTNIFERDETNNFRSAPIHIGAPEFAALRVEAPTNVATRQPITLTYLATNRGVVLAPGGWRDAFFLSTNALVDSNDVFIAEVPWNDSVPAGGSYTQQVVLTVPNVPAGDYYLITRVDHSASFVEASKADNDLALAVRIENPDLTPTNLNVPASLVFTQRFLRFPVNWTVLNRGAGHGFPNWADYIYLSRTNVFDHTAQLLTSEGISSTLNSSNSYTAFQTVQVNNAIEGEWFLHLVADGGNNLFEATETNNVITRPIQFSIPALPDLAVVNVSAPAETLSGQQVEISWVLTNAGTALVTREFRDRVYLAATPTGAGAIEFGVFPFVEPIPAGASVPRQQRITLPIDFSGTYWVLIVADSANEVFEHHGETNNTLVAAVPIQVRLTPTPNLAVSHATAPTETFSGNTTVVQWGVTNRGIGPTSAPYWYDAVYLSTDAVLSGNDTYLGQRQNLSFLDVGESYLSSLSVSLPRGLSGDYYLLVRTDSGQQVFEHTNETDNVTASALMRITLTPPPDLQVHEVRPPLNAFSGQPALISWIVTNAGPGQTAENRWNDRLWISTNDFIDGSARQLKVVEHVGALDTNGFYLATNLVLLPSGVTGDFYVIVTADAFNQVFENPFEGNNDGASTYRMRINLTPPPDLAISLLNAPSNALASFPVTVSYRVVNEGATATPNFSWLDRLYLSLDDKLSAEDVFLNHVGHYGQLKVGEDYQRGISGVIPNATNGSFYLLLVTDMNDEVFEVDNTNNLLVVGPITIESRPADLVVHSATASSSAIAGQSIALTWAVTNAGSGRTPVARWTDRVVLSADDFFGDSDDIVLSERVRSGVLTNGTEYVVTALAEIPITVSPGDYRLFILTDRQNEVFEGTNENNNVFGPLAIAITRDTADLRVVSIQSPLEATAGTNMTVSWVVENIGTRVPESAWWVDRIYLSLDDLLSPDDIDFGARQSFSRLEPGQSYTNSLRATTLPTLNSNYYVIVVTDQAGQVFEPGAEANNRLVSTNPTSIRPGDVPDLIVAAVNAPAEAFSGQTFQLSWVVENAGTATASAQGWYDAVYLSPDHFLDRNTDAYVGFRSRPRQLLPGERYTNSASFTIPPGLAGPFYVIVAADAGGNLFEREFEDNNLSIDPEAMTVTLLPPVDLVAGTITLPANARPGQLITVNFSVFNQGSNTARGSWNDALYISADTTWDVNDAFLGSVRHVGDVLGNTGYLSSVTAELPGVLPGDYFVIVRSDILNHLVEPNETNNIGASLNAVNIDAELLTLGTPAQGSMVQGQSVFFKFNANAGDTVRIRFNTGVPLAGAELFVRRGQMPTRGQFDFAANEPFLTEPDLIMPVAETGTYYLLAYGTFLPAPANYTVLAEVLPFSVATVEPQIAGNFGETTFEVRGALFDSETVFNLVSATNTNTSVRVWLADSTRAFVTFNLFAQPIGWRDLRAAMGTNVSVTLSNAVFVAAGKGPQIEVAWDGPLEVWAAFTIPLLLSWGNTGDADTLAPLIMVEPGAGTLAGSRYADLRPGLLQILGTSLNGPAGVIAPRTAHSQQLYYRGGSLRMDAYPVMANETKPISDADWLRLENSVRPPGSDEAAWDEFWAGIRPRVGSTWGDYVRFLNRLSAKFPATQRNVREMFASIFTNEPSYRAASFVAGSVQEAGTATPIANVEVGLYRDVDGRFELGGRAITDNAGQFLINGVAPGTYRFAVVGRVFDMNQDGTADSTFPTVTVTAGADIAGQTLHVKARTPLLTRTNDANASLVLDASGVLHSFWMRDRQVWHAWRNGADWRDAQPLTTNVVGGFAANAGSQLIDGSDAGLIAVWSEGRANHSDLFYAVGRPQGAGYQWSRPVRLTEDQVQDSAPAIAIGPNGLAMVLYLKRNAAQRDDTDLYYSIVQVSSGDLLWTAPARRAPAKSGLSDNTGKVAFGWGGEFGPYNALGIEFGAALELAAEGSITGCDAEAKGEVKMSLFVERNHAKVTGFGSGSIAGAWAANPKTCLWEFNQMTLNASAGVRLDLPDFAFVVMESVPQPVVQQAARRLHDAFDWVRANTGIRVTHNVGVEGALDFKGLRWTKDPAPTSAFRLPDSMDSVDGKFSFGIDFIAALPDRDDTLVFQDDLSLSAADPNDTFLGANGKVEFVFGVLPSFEAKNVSGSIKFTCIINGWQLASEVVPINYSFKSGQAPRKNGGFLPEGFTFTYRPELSVGTTNQYGSNAVLANVRTDLYRDGQPAVATNEAGQPFAVWFKEGNPFTGFGSELVTAEFNGLNWSAPQTLPNSRGFNSQVCAALDSLGQRLAVWVHADASGISSNTTAEAFFAARDAANVVFSTFNGTSWSTPSPISATAGRDTDLQLSRQTDGSVLAVWTHHTTNTEVHLVASRWNGTAWSAPEVITVGQVSTPTAQQVGSETVVLWTAVVGTNDTDTALFQSRYQSGTWGAPEVFDPQPLTPPAPAPIAKSAPAKASQTLLPFDVVPDRCCRCEEIRTEREGFTPGACLISRTFDVTNCIEKLTYQACPRVSFDPNDIVGPVGFGPERWVPGAQPLGYMIRFENDPVFATAPAKQVTIRQQLDPDLDPRTFRLGSFGFGDIVVEVPENSAFYSTRLDYTATLGFYLDFAAGVDVLNREAFWQISTIDPATGNLPLNPLLGFLPPNITSPEGEGFVTYTIRAHNGAAQGTRVDAAATIIFDTEQPIDTPAIFNTLEPLVPTSAVAALPLVTNTPVFMLEWSGQDAPGGSALAGFDIYMSVNDGAPTLLLGNTPATQVPFAGDFGVTYSFYSVARDNAGNLEPAPSLPDARITIATPNTAPVLRIPADTNIAEQVAFTMSLSATDNDVPTNTVSFALLSGPEGLTIASAGVLTWTPTEAQGPSTNIVVFVGTDNGTPSLSATGTFTIIVREVNRAPAFAGTNIIYLDELAAFTFTNVVVDADEPSNSVTLSAGALPGGASFDANTGVLTWTPTELQGPGTNTVTITATDSGVPSSNAVRTLTLIVREVNSAPTIDAVSNVIATPYAAVNVSITARDSDRPQTNSLSFALASNAPPSATIDSVTGAFRWTPGRTYAGTSNQIAVVVTDNGSPSLSATQTLVVLVEDLLEISLGHAALFTGQTSSIPIVAHASSPMRDIAFSFELPAGVLGDLALSNVFPAFASASIAAETETRWTVTFSNAAGQTFSGTQQLAVLHFRSVGSNSIALTLTPEAMIARLAGGTLVPHIDSVPGRIVVIGDRPVLDALRSSNGVQGLTVFGQPGRSYTIEKTTNLMPPIVWEFTTNVLLTNLWQRVEGLSNPPPVIYRARE